ncbi:MAG: peptidoglycan-binding protein [bacterium]
MAWDRFGGDSGEAQHPVVTAPVEHRTLQQTIVTRGTVSYPSAGQLLAVGAGRITSVDVTTGGTIEAGGKLLSVNGRPVIAIPGSLPFWRELSNGDEGEDVRQLETALRAEGFDPGLVDDTFTFATGTALRAWQGQHGFPIDGTFQAGDAAPGVWPVRTGAIRVAVGEFVAPGQVLLGFTEGTLEVLAQLAPTQRVRVKEGVVVQVEVTGNRKVVRGTLGAPREAPAVAAAPGQAAPEQTSYVAPVKLETPIEAVDGAQAQVTILLAEVPNALVVPLAAVVMDGAGKPSVQVQDADGSIRLVAVTTGLSEGAFIEVKAGLNGDETVLLEQR